jgi:LuxR family maltose regulon positive regulatory protein
MPTPLLLSKLNKPHLRPQRLFRPMLVQQLNSGLDGKLTLVCAPAGYGKTTLVLEWLMNLPEDTNTGWISLDENDNDPVRFIAYLIAAIQTSYPDIGDTSSMLQNPQAPPDEVILTALFNELTEISSPFVLILDDYHYIQTSSIHKFLALWLEHQPASLHLVIISREDPLLPIARLRAKGHLNEIRQENLRFSMQECADLLRNVMGISISYEHVAALERRTEGWAAGLQLAAVSLQHHADPDSFIREFTGSSRFILDYLIDEVLVHQTESMQKFLIKTAILERLTGPLCDAITGFMDSQERLEVLEQTNLFIVPLDQSRTWYRYHRLFSELLQHRLYRTEGEMPADLHDRASRWFEQNDFLAEAIQHAIAARNWDRTARLLGQVNDEMMKIGRTTTLVRWYAALPEDILLKDPRLCFDYCWPLLLTGQYTRAVELLDHVEGIAQDNRAFLGEIMTAQAYLARVQGKHELMMDRSVRARALLPRESVNSRGVVAINLALAYWHLGQMEATEEVLLEALESNRASSNDYAYITAVILQGRVAAVRAQLRSAAKIFKQAIESGGELPINALAHLDLSALYYEWNQLAEAAPHLQKAFDLSRRAQNEEFEVACWMMQACLNLADGSSQAAREALDQAQKLVDRGFIPELTTSRLEIAKLRLALAQNDLKNDRQPGNSLADDIDSHNFCRFTNLAKAKLFLAQNQFEQAEDYLVEQYKIASKHGWRYPIIAIRACQALAARVHDNAVYFIEDALKLAKPEGFMRIFIDLGGDLIPYLQEAARCGVEPGYVGQILNAIQNNAAGENLESKLAEPLSERELEVLRLIVAGLSNRQIAQDLVISLGTAKTHIHNIYGKLEAKNRAQAIARAQEIELV